MAKSRAFAIQTEPEKVDTRSQHERFVQMAKELGCDEDEAVFDEKLKVIAKAKPKAEEKQK